MKGIKFFALSALVVMTVAMASCNNRASAPRTNLRTTTDTISYAWGVNLANEGLTQLLEQMGVIQPSWMIESNFQSRINAADSADVPALERQKRVALDSLERANTSRLNEFIRGLRATASLEAESPYAAGLDIGMRLSQHFIPSVNHSLFGEDATESVNVNQILAGMIKSLQNRQLAIPLDEASWIFQQAMARAEEEQMARHEEQLREQFAEQIAAGAAFLVENARRAGVTVLPSGLQYEIIREGRGPRPTASDRVRVHYHGTLIDGEVFDSSVNRGESITFGVTQVIQGWVEALQLMPVGSKWKLFIPYDLAYGAQQAGIISPFSTLIFEVELLGIE